MGARCSDRLGFFILIHRRKRSRGIYTHWQLAVKGEGRDVQELVVDGK